jgi:hypothetical protein
MAMNNQSKLSKSQRCVLAAKVFQAVADEFASFNEEGVGADLAYLLGAILDDSNRQSGFVDWSRDCVGPVAPAILDVLRRSFPEESPLWGFIRLEGMEEKAER